MTGVSVVNPRIQLSDALGTPLSSGLLYTFVAGSTTTADTFKDQALTVKNTNPIMLDETGGCTVWLDPMKLYKFELRSVNGVTQCGWPVDNVAGAATALSLAPHFSLYAKLADLVAQGGSSLVGFIQTGVGAVLRTMQDKGRESVTPMDYGAIGNGIADDSDAIRKALAALPLGAWLEGCGRTYKVSGDFAMAAAVFRMRNFHFVSAATYAAQGQFLITSLTTELRNISVDGGRGTYKTGSEPWTKFATFAGYDSIRPGVAEFFKITSWNQAAQVTVSNFTCKNVHAIACIEINTYGTVLLDNHSYANVSNKTYHVYHSPDDGVTQYGRTIARGVASVDCGLLPDDFTVDGVAKTFAATTALPQAAFNFIVSHGDYTLSDAVVNNYASCGVTADRNKTFNGNNVTIRNTSNRSASNNPSGAMWLESCKSANICNLTIDVQDRDTRDTALDSSALQLFCGAGAKVNIINLIILGNTVTQKLNKAIRGSMYMDSVVNIDGFHISGLYGRTVDVGVLPNSVIGHEIRLKSGDIIAGDINIDQPKELIIDAVNMVGTITVATSGNPGITGSIKDVMVRRSAFGAFVNTATVTRALSIMDNDAIGGGVTCGNSTGNTVVQSNRNIADDVSVQAGTAGTVHILGNAIAGATTVISAKDAKVDGNVTQRRIEIRDVQSFTVNNNTAKTSIAEPIVWVNPSTPATVLAGQISTNNLLIKTGTVGAGYVQISGGVATVTDANNVKLTVAW